MIPKAHKIRKGMRERLGIGNNNMEEEIQEKSAGEILDGFEDGLKQQGEKIEEIRLDLERRLDKLKRSSSSNRVSITDDEDIKAEKFEQEDGKIERLRKRIKILMGMERKIEGSLEEIDMLRVDLRISDALGHNLSEELSTLTTEVLGSSFDEEEEKGHPLIEIHEGLESISQKRLEDQYGSHSEFEEVFMEEVEEENTEKEDKQEEDSEEMRWED